MPDHDDYDYSDETGYNPAEATGPENLWDSENAIESLKMERSVRPDETNEEMTRRILEEAGPLAAQSIVHLALHSQNDNTRLNAAKYVTGTLLEGQTEDGKASWEKLLGDAIDQAEIHANQGQG
jgi:hypothetical protein